MKLIESTESRWLAAAVLVTLVTRLWQPWQLSVEHFDEGVYASNVWFDEDSRWRYPGRAFYSPPLVPAIIESLHLVAAVCGFDSLSWLPIASGWLAGCLLMASAWWITRRWWGPPAGLAAAWLAASSDLHIAYSHTALTDPWLAFWWIWALFAWTIARRGSWPALIGCGVAIAAAWSSKYNGWLPLAVIPLAELCLWGLDRLTSATNRSARPLGPIMGRWLVVTLITGLGFVPVLWDLQADGGYVAISTNHRQYFTGLTSWTGQASQQLSVLLAYQSLLGGCGTALAFIAASQLNRSAAKVADHRPAIHVWARAGLIAVTATALPLISLVAGLGRVLSTDSEQSTRDEIADARAADALLVMMAIVLTVLVPCYTPYPRLMLPLVVVGWLLTSRFLAALAAPRPSSVAGSTPGGATPAAEAHPAGRLKDSDRGGLLNFAGATAVTLGLASWWCLSPTVVRPAVDHWGFPQALEPRDGLRLGVSELLETLQSRLAATGDTLDRVVVLTYAEPAAFYQLKSLGVPLVAPVGQLETLQPASGRPTYLLLSDRIAGQPAAWAEFQTLEKRLERVAEVRIPLSGIEACDQIPQRSNDGQLRFPGERTLQLFRLQP